MGNKRLVHLNELRVKAAAGDRMAQQQLAAEMWVPHHNRRSPGLLLRIHAKLAKTAVGSIIKQGLHVTAKSKRAIRTTDSITVPGDYGLDRLQMLVDRVTRREARA